MGRLNEAGYTRTAAATAVGTLHMQLPDEARFVGLLDALQTVYGGTSTSLVGEALRAAGLTTPRQVAPVLGDLMYSAAEAASILRMETGATGAQAVRALAEAGFSLVAWQSAVSAEYGVSPLQILAEEAVADGLYVRNVVGNADLLGVATGNANALAAVLSLVGFTSADMVGDLYIRYGLLSSMVALRDALGVDDPTQMVTALQNDHLPRFTPSVLVEALQTVLGTQRDVAVAALRTAGYSSTIMARYLSHESPKDVRLAALMRAYAFTAQDCWTYLERVGFTEIEGAAFMKAQGYALTDIVWRRFSSQQYLEGVSLAITQGYIRSVVLAAMMTDLQRRNEDTTVAALRTLRVGYLSGVTSLQEQLNLTDLLLKSRSAVVPVFATHAWYMRREFNVQGWELKHIATELNRPRSGYSTKDIADGVLAVDGTYTKEEKFDAIRIAVATSGRPITLPNNLGEVLVGFLAALGISEPGPHIAAVTLMAPGLGARTVVELMARRGYSWKGALALAVISGLSLSEAASVVLDVYKPIIIYEAALSVVLPGGLTMLILRAAVTGFAQNLAAESPPE